MNEELLFPEAFEGWRGWSIVEGRLTSINQEFVWQPGQEVQAACDGRHPIPKLSCSCGLYSTKSWRKLQTNGYHMFGAFGLVSLWGRVLEGTLGYRSEFAYPKMIFLSYLNLKWVEPLSVYGVPVKLYNPYKTKVPS